MNVTEPHLVLKLRKDWRYPAALAALILSAAAVFGIIALVYALHTSNAKLDHQDDAAVCRSRAAVALDTADGDRTDALADLIETIGRQFDASYRHDEDARAVNAAQLPALYGRLHEATAAIQVARQARAVSIEACKSDPNIIPPIPTTR